MTAVKQEDTSKLPDSHNINQYSERLREAAKFLESYPEWPEENPTHPTRDVVGFCANSVATEMLVAVLLQAQAVCPNLESWTVEYDPTPQYYSRLMLTLKVRETPNRALYQYQRILGPLFYREPNLYPLHLLGIKVEPLLPPDHHGSYPETYIKFDKVRGRKGFQTPATEEQKRHAPPELMLKNEEYDARQAEKETENELRSGSSESSVPPRRDDDIPG
jgi:hypothetical protein